MRILAVIQHEQSNPGVFADEATARGDELDLWLAIEGPPPHPLSEYDAVMAFGGTVQADEDDLHPWLRRGLEILGEALERDVPTLGVCLGAQMLARAAGGAVGPAERAEWAWNQVELTDAGMRDPLFAGWPRMLDVFQSHSYSFELPPEAVALARIRVPAGVPCRRSGMGPAVAPRGDGRVGDGVGRKSSHGQRRSGQD